MQLQVPLMFGSSSQLAVSEEYICSLVEQANAKLHTNWARVQRFLELLRLRTQQPCPTVQSKGKQKQRHAG